MVSLGRECPELESLSEEEEAPKIEFEEVDTGNTDQPVQDELLEHETYHVRLENDYSLYGKDHLTEVYIFDSGATINIYGNNAEVNNIHKGTTAKVLQSDDKHYTLDKYCTGIFGYGLYNPQIDYSLISHSHIKKRVGLTTKIIGENESYLVIDDRDPQNHREYLFEDIDDLPIYLRILPGGTSTLVSARKAGISSQVEIHFTPSMNVKLKDLQVVKHLHEALAHPGKEKFLNTIKSNHYDNWNVQKEAIDVFYDKGCLICKIAKKRALKKSKLERQLKATNLKMKPGESLHMDIVYIRGPHGTQVLYLTAVDEATRYMKIVFLLNRKDETVINAIKSIVSFF